MTDEKPRVIIIPPKPELQQTAAVTKQLRVAAYCRVSTKEEEQASSYEAQCEYYTDKIMSNKEWTMAGIFADEGISGTSTKKRTEFLRMIRQCRQKKIDLILTKSIQRFARNTLDCINYTRILRQLGIGVLFEKENINSLPPDSEFMITMYGAMAQSESESISGNVKWGKKRAMEAGKVSIAYKNLYAYEKGADGKPAPIPAQAEIVRELYTRYLAGASLRELKDWLEHGKQPTVAGGTAWSITAVKGILTNEKYCGDVLLQKTFSTDVISKKVVKNTGQLPKYLIQNHHEGIVTREQFQAVQAELARRSALRSDSKQAATGRSCYTSKYALSDRLICGECGKLYRRKTRNIKGNIYHEWRCISRLDYGKKYCKDSPTIFEDKLKEAIVRAVNKFNDQDNATYKALMRATIGEALGLNSDPEEVDMLERKIEALNNKMLALVNESVVSGEGIEAHESEFMSLSQEVELLKQRIAAMQESAATDSGEQERLEQIQAIIAERENNRTEYDDSIVRQMIECIKVYPGGKLEIIFGGGYLVEETV